jgi:hypothetical protein
LHLISEASVLRCRAHWRRPQSWLDPLAWQRTAYPSVDHGAEHRPRDGSDPEHPQLRQRPTADDHRRSRAPRRVHREVGDRDTDQVDQRQPEADGDRGEPARAAIVGRAENDERNIIVRTISASSPACSE